ncbi:hypothetical protein [Mycolicibacterium sp. XJ1819]
MPVNPAEAEASGQKSIPVEYGGQLWSIPLDVDFWPLDQILNCVIVVKDQFRPNDLAVLPALRTLLGDQWGAFTRVAPKRRHLVAASQTFAAAVGFPRREWHPLDIVFGAIPPLLFDLKNWQDAVEATLGDLGVDYRDRWRFDENGQRRLTLRQIHVRLTYAPFDCALRVAKNNGRPPFSGTELLLMDVWERLAGQAHPSRPLPPAERDKRAKSKKKYEEYRERQKRRQSSRDDAVATARANAHRERRAHA